MQVPEEMLKCVVFVYVAKGNERKPAGTAFFVGYPVPGYTEEPLGLLLTANHVIAAIRAHGDDGKVHLRFNKKTGGTVWAAVPLDAWHQPDSKVDCAMFLFRPEPELGVDYRAWALSPAVATDEVIREEGIGLGDEVFTVGLFRNHLGTDQNEPIVRVGNIAAFPTSEVQSKDFGPLKAILVEARSIGGLSGSPVFVHMGYARWREGEDGKQGEVARAGIATPFFLLGIMHGHWDAPLNSIDEKINVGIAIVVPAEQIMNAIRPIMDEMAALRRKQRDSEGGAVADSLGSDASEFERFRT